MMIPRVVIFVPVLLFGILIGITSAQIPTSIPPPTNALQVFALPVGQGDCTIIQCPNGNIAVFDCGSSGGNKMTKTEVQSWLGNNGINRVVAILVSHIHRDHHSYLPFIAWNTTSTVAVIIGGAISNYPKSIHNWLNGWNNLGKLFTIGTLQSSPSSCTGNCFVNTGTNFCSNQNIQFTILAANVGANSQPNQQSVVMKMVVGQWSMLLSGDMEGDASLNIAKQLRAGLQSLVYKMSHHGASRLANMIGWLTPIAPHFAFASSAFNYGIYKHPRCDTINRLLSLKNITMTTPHQFYCGTPGGPFIDNNFQFNMLETSPNLTHICLLTYVSANIQPQSNCFLPTVQFQVTNDMDIDDEYDDLNAGDGGAFSVVASSFVLTAATLLCFIM